MKAIKRCGQIPVPKTTVDPLSLNNTIPKYLTNSSPSSVSMEGKSMDYNISIKDGIVIGFMLGLWLYSIILMFRAWSKILNFSDDQANRPEKAAFLWKWLMEHIKNKKDNSSRKNSCEVDNDHHSESGSSAPSPQLSSLKKFPVSASPQCSCDEVVVVHHQNGTELIAKELPEAVADTSAICISEDTKQDLSNSSRGASEADSRPSTSANPSIASDQGSASLHHHHPQENLRPPSKKRRLQKQAKSLGQYEFKAMAFTSDVSLVQERLAFLDRNDVELETVVEVKSSSPPALPPRDYFINNEDVV